MSKTIKLGFDSASIANALMELQAYQLCLLDKAEKLAIELTMRGFDKASVKFTGAKYDGPRSDIKYDVEDRGDGVYAIVISGTTAVIIEFGAGVTYGYGHPQADEFGMGPGTFPDAKGHWDDPNGWYLPKSAGGGHTMGNPPSRAMYDTSQELRNELAAIAREVFET